MQVNQIFRKSLKVSAITLTLTLGGFFLEHKLSYACSCANPYMSQRSAHIARARATVVFAGKVNNIEPTGSIISKVSFSVYRMQKGDTTLNGKEVSLITDSYCGSHFEPDRAYFVYAREENQQIHTHDCNRTKLLIYAAVDIFELAMPPIEENIPTGL